MRSSARPRQHSTTEGSNLTVRAFAPGIYPRSEALVQATRDLDRGRTTADAVGEQVQLDFDAFVGVQESAGLDLLSDGMLQAQDLFRPLADATVGLEARSVTRFLDTNTFYRALDVEGKPRFTTPLPAPTLPSRLWLATLPSPLSFSLAAHGTVSSIELAAEVLAPQIEDFVQAGCALVVLAEPFLLSQVDPAGAVAELGRALEELPSSAPLVLQLAFGDASEVLDRCAELPAAAVGVDFYATPLDAVPREFPKEIVAGIIDARGSSIESLDEIGTFVRRLLERQPAGLSLAPNGDLQFVSEPIARVKVERLGQAKAAFAEAS